MKRNFKKAVSLALASTMALSLAACGGTSASTDTTAAGKAEGGDSAASNEEVTLKFHGGAVMPVMRQQKRQSPLSWKSIQHQG